MKYSLILVLSVLATVKVSLQSGATKSHRFCLRQNTGFNALIFFTAAVCLCPFLFVYPPDFNTVLFGIVLGVLSVAFQICYVSAFSFGKMSLTVIINNFSMLIPITVSAVVFGERFNLLTVIGVILTVLSFLLNTSREKAGTKVKNSQWRHWLLFTVLTFLANGILSVNQIVYTRMTEQVNSFGFTAIAYLSATAVSGLLLLFLSRTNERKLPRKAPILLSGVACGIVLGLFQCINTYTVSQIDGTVLFPVYNTSTSVLLALVGIIVFRERLTLRQTIGVFTGLLSIMFLCLS